MRLSCRALLVALATLVTVTPRAAAQRPGVDPEGLPYTPRHYVGYRAPGPIQVDGRLDEAEWGRAPWSEPFVDIDGVRPVRQATRVKMLWDDTALYIAAQIDETDVWGTLTTRDAVIFQDNDFEVFIDPDGDTHAYYELEVNALATPWDLLLVRPYRDGGPAVHAWDIAGLQVGVQVQGTINRPGDRDQGWTVELALPWAILKEAAPRAMPRDGDQWRVNFSRVEWTTDIAGGAYRKRTDPSTGKPLPEDNWVWSPQGTIDMHMPERWGILQFSDAVAGTREVPFVEDRNDRVRWALRRLYYRQRAYRQSHGRYATDLTALRADDIAVDGLDFRPTLETTSSLYEISAPGFDGTTVRIRHDGRVWVEPATRRQQ